MLTRIAASLVLFLGSMQVAPAWADMARARQLNFDVFLDDRPVGFQRFALVPVDDGIRVESRAEFTVRILGITAFEYFHQNVEQWRGDCLHSIDSRTDSNGTVFEVRGRAEPTGFSLRGEGNERRLPACIGTFAYWDKDQLLGRDQLLNPQTGEHLAVEIRRVGTRQLRFGERELTVEQYALRGQDIDIVLSYAAGSGEWLALETRLNGGRVLRYKRAMDANSAPKPT